MDDENELEDVVYEFLCNMYAGDLVVHGRDCSNPMDAERYGAQARELINKMIELTRFPGSAGGEVERVLGKSS